MQLLGARPRCPTPCVRLCMYSNEQTVPNVLSGAGCRCSEYCQRIWGAHRFPLYYNTVVSCCGYYVHGRRRGTERCAVAYLILSIFHRVPSVQYRSGWGNLTINDAAMVYVNMRHFRLSLLSPDSDIRTVLPGYWRRRADKRLGDPSPSWMQEPSVVRGRDGRPPRGPSGSALLLCV